MNDNEHTTVIEHRIETYFRQKPHGLGESSFPEIREACRFVIDCAEGESTSIIYAKAIDKQLAEIETRYPNGIGVEYEIDVHHKNSGPYCTIRVHHPEP